MVEPRQASVPPRSAWQLALASGAACTALLLLIGPGVATSPALAYELRQSTATAESAAERFFAACASGQDNLVSGLSAGNSPTTCPVLPRTLGLRVVLMESERLEPDGLRLRGFVALRGERAGLRVDLRRQARRWYVSEAELE